MIEVDDSYEIPVIRLNLGPFSTTGIILDAVEYDLIELLGSIESSAIVFDLSSTGHLGSKAIAILVNAWQTMHAKNGRIGYCALNPYNSEVLRTMHLDRHWEVYATVDEAVHALTPKQST